MDQLLCPPMPGVLGILLLEMERRALRLKDVTVLPVVHEDLPDVHGAVAGLLNQIATMGECVLYSH